MLCGFDDKVYAPWSDGFFIAQAKGIGDSEMKLWLRLLRQKAIHTVGVNFGEGVM